MSRYLFDAGTDGDGDWVTVPEPETEEGSA